MLAVFAFSSIAIACALLSLVVVTRRWAFIGEGIGHSGFGGAGTAWMLMAFIPALDAMPWLPYACVVTFSFAVALGMGMLSRHAKISGDVAVGIFLVATVAWGFVGQRIYSIHKNADPVGFNSLFFGQPHSISVEYALAAAGAAVAVVLALVALRKEVLAYCIDPQLAEVSGVSAGFIHYLLITLVAIATIIGMQVVGSLLITALLVLPGATATLLSKRLTVVACISVTVGLIGAIGGHVISVTWPVIPVGPAIVLVMFAVFLLSLSTRKFVTPIASRTGSL